MAFVFVAIFLGTAGVMTGVIVALHKLLTSDVERARNAARACNARPIRDVTEGELVKIVGHAHAVEPPMRAPITGRACFHLRVVEKRIDDFKNSQTRVLEHRTLDVFVRDDTGKALVRLAGGDIDAFLVAHRHEEGEWPHERTITHETVIEEGTRVAVVGYARFEPDPSPSPDAMGGSYREPPRCLVLAGRDRFTVKLTADPSVMS